MSDLSIFQAGNWDLASLFLLSLRMAAVFLMTPVLYALQLPGSVRLLLILSLAVVLTMGLPHPAAKVPNDWSNLWVAAGSELALGATLGLGILIAFGAFAMAGRLLDVQVGFGLAQVFDPLSRQQIPVLNAAFNQIGILVFFLLDGHHALLRGIVSSLDRFPLGAAWSPSAASGAVMGQMTGLFMLGFSLVAPVVFCVLLVELALGVVARNLPQMNMFVIALPAKTAVALIALSLWSSGIGGVMTRVYASIATDWEKVMMVEVGAPDLKGPR
jgi:flagellar biosynthetic protein FliR